MFTFLLLFFFMFSKTYLCKVNFDLFTKLFLVVGVCWLFQVGFSFLERKIFLYTFNVYLFFRLLPCWTYQLWSTLERSSLCCRYYCKIWCCDIVRTNLLILDLMTLFQGPLIFVVAMCRTRVAFLFKRYFCQVPSLCCRLDVYPLLVSTEYWYNRIWFVFCNFCSHYTLCNFRQNYIQLDQLCITR